MKTYIIDNTLHVEFTEAENHAVHAAGWVPFNSYEPADARLGRVLVQQIKTMVRERFQRTGKPTPIKVKVEDPKPRVDGLEEQREAWAREAAFLTGYDLKTCRHVANNTNTEGQAMGVLEMAAMSRKSPESIIEQILSHK